MVHDKTKHGIMKGQLVIVLFVVCVSAIPYGSVDGHTIIRLIDDQPENLNSSDNQPPNLYAPENKPVNVNPSDDQPAQYGHLYKPPQDVAKFKRVKRRNPTQSRRTAAQQRQRAAAYHARCCRYWPDGSYRCNAICTIIDHFQHGD